MDSYSEEQSAAFADRRDHRRRCNVLTAFNCFGGHLDLDGLQAQIRKKVATLHSEFKSLEKPDLNLRPDFSEPTSWARSGREQMQQKYLRATNRVCNAA